VVIDAGLELTANGGGSFLKLDPSGVTLCGATIKLNSGGAPGVGSGIGILLPVIPGAADKDQAGSLTKLAAANAPGVIPLAEAARKTKQGYDLDFLITAQNTGLPLPNFPYVITTESGRTLSGRTDPQGRTQKVASHEAETATIEIYDDVPPLNPHWDA
jgi:type VI secretion system secreted protein VgrG